MCIVDVYSVVKTDKSVVFMAGAAPDTISSQQGINYNGKIYCMTPTELRWEREIHYVIPEQ